MYRITLYYDGLQIATRTYTSKFDRDNTIEMWRKTYGPRFRDTTIKYHRIEKAV